MKKVLILFVSLMIVFTACDTGTNSSSDGESDPTTTLVTESEAEVADDGQATGVYKGVIADDEYSGTYKIVIDESTASGRAAGDEYDATLYFEVEGTEIEDAGTAVEQSDGSLAVSFDLTVVGVTFGFDLTISSTGDSVDTTVTLDGDVIYSTTLKEESTTLVEAWEGTFSGNINDDTIPDLLVIM